MDNRYDRVKDVERKRNHVIHSLSSAQVALNMLSYEDKLLAQEWRDRAALIAEWAGEAESHCNAIIDSLLS